MNLVWILILKSWLKICLFNTTVPKLCQVSYNDYSKSLLISKTNTGSYHFVGGFLQHLEDKLANTRFSISFCSSKEPLCLISLLNLKRLFAGVLKVKYRYIKLFSGRQKNKLNKNACPSSSSTIVGIINWNKINPRQDYWYVNNICGSLLFALN